MAKAKSPRKKAAVKDPAKKVITVAIEDLGKVCHICGEVKENVYRRSYRTKDYQGSCGDSFCWASCDMTSCKGRQNVQACGDCEAQKR